MSDQAGLRRVARWEWIALATISALALLLRLWNLDALLPHLTESDGLVLATQVDLLRSGAEHPERELLFGFYPHLVAWLALLIPHAKIEAHTLAEQLALAARSYGDPRMAVAIASVLIVPGTWALARRFLAPGAALLAAAFSATSLLHLWFAQQARPHAVSSALAVLAVVAALRLFERGKALDFLLGGLAAGLAIAALQSGIAVLLPLGLALVLRRPEARASSLLWLVPALAIIALCVRVFYPFLFGPSQSELGAGGGEFHLSGHVVYFDLFNGQGFMTVVRTLVDYDPWLTLCAVLGGAALLARRTLTGRGRELAIVLAYAVPYFVMIALYQRTYQRFVIPLVPYLACLAAWLVWTMARRVAQRIPLAPSAAMALFFAPQAAPALRLLRVRAAPDTIEQAARWIESSRDIAPEHDRILVQPSFDLPLPQSAAALEANVLMMDNRSRPWFRLQRSLPAEQRLLPAWNLIAMPLRTSEQMRALNEDGPAYLRSLGADWFVIEVYSEGRTPLLLDQIPPALPAVAERVARFTPDHPDRGDDLPLLYQDDGYPRTEVWAWRLYHMHSLGPTIEIWRAKR